MRYNGAQSRFCLKGSRNIVSEDGSGRPTGLDGRLGLKGFGNLLPKDDRKEGSDGILGIRRAGKEKKGRLGGVGGSCLSST